MGDTITVELFGFRGPILAEVTPLGWDGAFERPANRVRLRCGRRVWTGTISEPLYRVRTDGGCARDAAVAACAFAADDAGEDSAAWEVDAQAERYADWPSIAEVAAALRRELEGRRGPLAVGLELAGGRWELSVEPEYEAGRADDHDGDPRYAPPVRAVEVLCRGQAPSLAWCRRTAERLLGDARSYVGTW